MAIVTQVWNKLLELLVQLWNTCIGGTWGIFGTFIIFHSLIRLIARTFNKLKS